MNIIGATRWQSEGWARAGGLEMLSHLHTRVAKICVGSGFKNICGGRRFGYICPQYIYG